MADWERRPWPDNHRGGGSWLACNETSTANLRALRTLVEERYGSAAARAFSIAEDMVNEKVVFPVTALFRRIGIVQPELAVRMIYNRAGQIAGRELKRYGIEAENGGYAISAKLNLERNYCNKAFISAF